MIITDFKTFEKRNNFAIGDIVIFNSVEFHVIIGINGNGSYQCNQLGRLFNNIIWSEYSYFDTFYSSYITKIDEIDDWLQDMFYDDLPINIIEYIKNKHGIDLTIPQNIFFKKRKIKNNARKFKI